MPRLSSFALRLFCLAALSLAPLRISGVENASPTVEVTGPLPGERFAAGEDVTVTASASDADDGVQKVKFYADGAFADEDAETPYSVTLEDLSRGIHQVEALAFDTFSFQSEFAGTWFMVGPGATFPAAVPRLFPGVSGYGPLIGSFETSDVHRWKVFARGSGSQKVDIKIAASAVNGEERGSISALLVDDEGRQSARVAHPSSGNAERTMELTLTGGRAYDLEIQRVPPDSGSMARHYKLAAVSSNVEIAFEGGLRYLSQERQFWVIHTEADEDVKIQLFADSEGSGRPDQAGFVRASLRSASGAVVVPSSTYYLPAAISASKAAGGPLVLCVEEADGYFRAVKASGSDDGFYLTPTPPEASYTGLYYNLPSWHPDVEGGVDTGGPGMLLPELPLPDLLPVLSTEGAAIVQQFDWHSPAWFRFARVDGAGALDFPHEFFPIAKELSSDPSHFAVHWRATVEAPESGEYGFVAGSDDDLWIFVDGVLKADRGGLHSFAPAPGSLALSAGVHQLDIYFAERHTTGSAIQFRFDDFRLIPKALPLPEPVVIQEIRVSEVGVDSALITWLTDVPASSAVLYGTDSENFAGMVQDRTLATSHEMRVTGLQDNKRHYFRVASGVPDFARLSTRAPDELLSFDTVKNEAPATAADSYATGGSLTVAAPSGVLANDTDVNGQPLTGTLSKGPEHGSVSFSPEGSFRYVPEFGFRGTDTFEYKAWDGIAHSSSTMVSINVGPSSIPPVVHLSSPEVAVLSGGAAGYSAVIDAGAIVRDPDNADLRRGFVSAAVVDGGSRQDWLNIRATGQISLSDPTALAFNFSYSGLRGAISSARLLGPSGQIYDLGSVLSNDGGAAPALLGWISLGNKDGYNLSQQRADLRDGRWRMAITTGAGDEVTGSLRARGLPDQFELVVEGSFAGSVAGLATLGSDTVLYEGRAIGSFAGGLPSLSVALNENATIPAVQALVRSLVYGNGAAIPSTDPRMVEITVSDGTAITAASKRLTLALPIRLDGSVTERAFSELYGVHAYAFEGRAGQILYYDGMIAYDGGVYLELFAPSGNHIWTDSAHANSGPIFLKETGTYLLKPRNYGAFLGEYRFALHDLDQAPVLMPGILQEGVLAPLNSSDVYVINANAGDRFTLNSSQTGGSTYTNWRVLDSNGLGLASNDIQNDLKEVPFSETGRYYLVIDGYGPPAGSFSYQFAMEDATGAPVSPAGFDEPRTGTLADGETKVFEFTAAAGTALYIDSLRSDSSGLSALLRFGDEIYSFDPRVDAGPFVLLHSGQYAVELRGSGGASAYGFRLLNWAAASPITVNAARSGTVSLPRETRLFQFHGTAGDWLYIDGLESAANKVGLRILNPPGNQAILWDDSFNDAGPAILPFTGDYRLTVENDGDTAANYDFRLLLYSPTTGEGRRLLQFGQETSGSINPASARELYQFEGKPGQRLFFHSISASGAGSWVVRNPRGDFVAGSPLDASFEYTMSSAGTHMLELSASGSSALDYVFKVSEMEDERASAALDTIISGKIGEPGETDTFLLRGLSAGQRIVFDSLFGASGSVFATLIAPNGQTVFHHYSVAQDSGPYTLTEDGNYHLQLLCFGSGTGDYRFRILDLAGALPLPLNVSQRQEAIPGSGIAPYVFAGSAGDRVLVQASRESGDFGSYELVSPSGQTMFHYSMFFESVEVVLKETGPHHLLMHGPQVDGAASFVVKVTSSAPAAAEMAGMGIVLSGDVSSAGSDAYEIEAPAGTWIYLDSLNSAASTVSIVGSHGEGAGRAEVFSVSAAFDSNPIFLPHSGVYRIEVRADQSDPQSYSFRLLDMGAAPTVTAGEVVTKTTTLANQTELFRFSGAAGQGVILDILKGAENQSAFAARPPHSQDFLYAEGAEDSFPAVLSADGVCYVIVRRADAGEFSFRLLDGSAAPELPMDTLVSARLSPGSGALIYQFEGAAGDRLYFDAISTSASGFARLIGPANDYMGQWNLNDDTAIALQRPGVHWLILHGQGSEPFDCQFQMREPENNRLPPAFETAPFGSGTGLLAEYFNGLELSDLALARVDSRVSFDWSGTTPSAFVGYPFSARWTGKVQPLFSEKYTFHTISDKGVRLKVNGQQIINHWEGHGWTEDTGEIELVAGGLYDIELEYFEDHFGTAVIQLLWSSLTQPRQIVPTSQLYPATLANQRPSISQVSSQAGPVNTPIGPISFEVSDAESVSEALLVTVISTNPQLFPSLVVSGTGRARTLTLEPAANRTGRAVVVVTVQDPQGAMASATFDVLVGEPLAYDAFSDGAEGWKAASLHYQGPYQISAGPFEPQFVAEGGNPGGHLSFGDPDGDTWYWQAPESFLGDQSTALGGALRFDRKQSGSVPFSDPDVVLIGNGMTLVFGGLPAPVETWTTAFAPLDSGAGWRRDSLTGSVPTPEEFENVLRALTHVLIRGEYFDGPDVGGLDNVRLLRGEELPIRRAVRLSQWNLPESGVVRAIVEMDADGSENSVAFSLSFDADVLSFRQARLADGSSPMTLDLNTAQAANGLAGVSLARPAGQTIPPGRQPLLELEFEMAPARADYFTTVTFAGAPAALEARDAAGNILEASFAGANLILFNLREPHVLLQPGFATGRPGDEVVIPVMARGFSDLKQLQFSLHWSVLLAELLGVEDFGLPELGENDLDLSHSGGGTATISWSSATGVTTADGTTLFALRFRLKGSMGAFDRVLIDGLPVALQAYNQPGDRVPLVTIPGLIQVFGQVNVAGTVSYYAREEEDDDDDDDDDGDERERLSGLNLKVNGVPMLGFATDSEGNYALPLPFGEDYVIAPEMDGGAPTRGISMMDIVHLRRHILGLASLASPYQLIAADVNGSGTATTLDITLIRRVILGLGETFPAGAWKFISTDETFPNPSAPWGYVGHRSYDNLLHDQTGQDFLGIKLGDVNGSWTAPEIVPGDVLHRAGSGVELILSRSITAPGQPAVVEARAKRTMRGLTSLQFSLEWNGSELRLERVSHFGLRGLEAGLFNLSAPGRMGVAWDDPQGLGVDVEAGQLLFTLEFSGGGSSAIQLAATPVAPEATLNAAPAPLQVQSVELSRATAMLSQVSFLSNGGGLTAAIATETGKQYLLETTTDLGSGTWDTVMTAAGNGSIQTVSDRSEPAAQRFYRVRVIENSADVSDR